MCRQHLQLYNDIRASGSNLQNTQKKSKNIVYVDLFGTFSGQRDLAPSFLHTRIFYLSFKKNRIKIRNFLAMESLFLWDHIWTLLVDLPLIHNKLPYTTSLSALSSANNMRV